jgi:arylsulfatase A
MGYQPMSSTRSSVVILILGLLTPGLFAQSPPNIVVILADDMGYGDPRCYNPESKIPTPNLDALAKRGVRFTDAHAPAAWCVPSRYGLMTGRYPMRGRGYNAQDMKQPVIESTRLTLPAMLKKANYTTACFGKWHLGFEGGHSRADYAARVDGGPLARGFDHYFGIPGSLDFGPYCWFVDDRVPTPPTMDIGPGGPGIQGPFWRAGKIAPDFKIEAVLPELTRRSVDYVRRQKGAGRPFFLYLALPAPHTPWLPAAGFKGKSGAGEYGDFAMQVDDAVGQVMAALAEAGVEQDTLVIFASDNGPVWFDRDVAKFGHRSAGPWRGMKSDLYEGGHRVPFIARWPNRVAAGTTIDQMLCFTDLFATFAGIVGQPVPADAAEDSHDLSPLFLGRAPAQPIRRTLMVEDRLVRRDEWKLVLGRPAGNLSPDRSNAQPIPLGSLYNLKDDPGETTDLYAKNPEKVEELRSLRLQYQRDGRSVTR